MRVEIGLCKCVLGFAMVGGVVGRVVLASYSRHGADLGFSVGCVRFLFFVGV